MDHYDHKKIEKKWQTVWDKEKLYQAKIPKTEDKKSSAKFYALIEFPYPSGQGLHVGHIRSNTAMDIIARKRRREGFNVLYPIGWDAFGLPTENYAIKTGIEPAVVTKKNSDTFRRQLKALGFSFDWSREVNTSDPHYYRWTQWIFLQFLKAGLAYKKKMAVNWCPKDLIVLANEEVIDGKCERCDTPVEKREKEQWMLAITKYADRLDRDLDTVDYIEPIKIQQRNWIGRSEGAEIDFQIRGDIEDRAKGHTEKIKVFTTRPDTLFGVTYIVLAPEHHLVRTLLPQVTNREEVEKYIANVKKRSDIDRTDETKEKTGVQLKGISAVNPAYGGNRGGEKSSEKGGDENENADASLSVWIADYVLADYGTGAVMAVPAHDERDWLFAKKYTLPIKEVIMPLRVDKKNPPQSGKKSVLRKTVHALVLNPKDGTILCVKWKKFPWTGFIVGGVDGGEDEVDAARREVLEETGYKNIKFIRVLGGTVRGEYYAAHKDENRIALSHAVLFELENADRVPVVAEEMEKHEAVWLDPKKLNHDNFTCAELDLWFERLHLKDGARANDAYIGDGVLINSGKFDGKDSQLTKKEITEYVGGKWVVKYKLRDWIFSRQRYWGEPIPVIHCAKCGIVSVPEADLPVKLPKVKNYKPTETGESPLAAISKWVNVKCPHCHGAARRETDTMPNWAGSSWYYLRYVDPKNTKAFASPEALKYWTPVDWYNGGMEHTTLHLLYSRFWHKFLFDQGLVPTPEPYHKRTSHGLILAKGGEKMSKSKGNVTNPDDIVEAVGADSLRLYEMFMGPFDQAIVWDENGIVGTRRFIEKVWKLGEKIQLSEKTEHKRKDKRADTPVTLATPTTLTTLIHKTIKKVSDDIEAMRFNTAVSALMIAVNEMEKMVYVSKENYGILLQLLAPFAPHVTEELWHKHGYAESRRSSIHTEKWPTFDPAKIAEASVRIAVQINGKTRTTFKIDAQTASTMTDGMAREKALALDEIKSRVYSKNIKKVIYVKGRLINIVIDENVEKIK